MKMKDCMKKYINLNQLLRTLKIRVFNNKMLFNKKINNWKKK